MGEGTQLVRGQGYPIAALNADFGEVQEAMGGNISHSGIDLFSMPQIKVPTGGETEWRVPGLKGTEHTKLITVLVVAWREGRAYYRTRYSESGGVRTPPNCSSEDALVGFGDPGGDCKQCPLAKFGSSTLPGSNAQACKHFRVMLVMRQNSLMPEVLTVPPTSLKAANKFFYLLATHGIPYHQTLIEISLNRTKSGGGQDYAEMVFAQSGERFVGPASDKAKALSGLWSPTLNASAQIMRQVGADIASSPGSVLDSLPDPPRSMNGGVDNI